MLAAKMFICNGFQITNLTVETLNSPRLQQGLSCTASRNNLLEWAQHAACTILGPPIWS